MDGTGGGAVIDAGPPCSGASVPPLACRVLQLQAAGLPGQSWLATNEDGFLAAWAETSAQRRVELRGIALDGGTFLSVIYPTSEIAEGVSASGAGKQWALVWNTGADTPVSCVSSMSPTQVELDGGNTGYRRAVVAISDAGAIGIAAPEYFSQQMGVAESAQGCPTAFTARYWNSANNALGVSASFRPGDGVFVYTRSGSNPLNGTGDVHIFQGDGGYKTYLLTEQLYDSVGAISDDGNFVQIVAALPDGGLTLRSVRSDLSQSIAAVGIHLAANVQWWNNASCGPDCFSIIYVDRLGGGIERLRAHLTDVGSAPRPGSPRDVLCSVPSGSTAGIAWYQGKLGVLVARATGGVELRICEMP
mgnify:CR=1 FL=1